LISLLSAFHSLQASLCFAGLGLFLLLRAIIRPLFKNNVIPGSVACVSLRAPPQQEV
jgi:hypothetical protein